MRWEVVSPGVALQAYLRFAASPIAAARELLQGSMTRA
jgi:hypothetical protein